MFPWVLTPGLGWGWVEVPPRTVSLGVTWVFPREFKKGKKNKLFFGTVFKLKFIALEP